MTPEAEYAIALAENADRWVFAAGGSERPFSCKGRRLVYCFNPALGKHAYLDLDRDLVLSNEEAQELLP